MIDHGAKLSPPLYLSFVDVSREKMIGKFKDPLCNHNL